MSLVEERVAETDAPILDILAARWSTRLYDDVAPVDDDALASALEAARWAPSAFNAQPWRFVVARRGTATHEKVVSALVDFNKAWAGPAGALVVFVAQTEVDGKPVPTALYDLGQAAAHFTVQAHADGLYTHQMTGFDPAVLAEQLGIEAPLVPVTVMAVGDLGDVDAAPAAVRERELSPRTRRPVAESVLVDD
ncbi:nitroreductase family protein [Microbacterium thalli]|uniref:Nitroreductase family protein n=1 Tax=Microbacterium thalli TaxID=3027921 RepID=A0ABT5SEF1_9MICO|nr:nitroreductase family protein [Microbacterium thalli]MDD7928613.1 nitroreductase family protein [Microbacterium thalli]MDD7961200.1 nitroreductase family protein [Microbacterium thalli]MDN8549380.1 nitroreductase family protein [Microbacterium thalli]